ncbi:hypothetical protein TNCT_173531 [Trichonephila clavata]|uniref:Uncharacterized protein n=1 Tax=Trichonephila clavata TaxID=2740835 RepID=A0A8X6JA45_TRICU|nr:hypothetical protein TNCT_173531 [Trichonephila clavata]
MRMWCISIRLSGSIDLGMVNHMYCAYTLWDPSHQRESLEVGFDECATPKRGIGSCSNNQTAEETGACTTYVYQLVESVDLRLC